MTEPSSDRPPRRPRYRGTHPRSFSEKYKEHQPGQYPEEVARILASGKTPAGSHRPIMVREILSVLKPRPGEHAIDCTLGYGGHAKELLAAIIPTGKLLGLDVDPIELPKTESRLAEAGFPPENLVVRKSNFAGLSRAAAEIFPAGADLILADLGVSSMQLDDPQRGFSFKFDAPLDMRMNPGHGQSAAALLTKLDLAKLTNLLTENADEPHAARIAAAIVRAQSRQKIGSTRTLAAIVQQAMQSAGRTEEEATASVRRVFQAIRIAVNDEFGALDSLLRQIPTCLKPDGRIAILTFHSGEDRRVKQSFKQGLREGLFQTISDEVIRPSAEEQHANPRSTSAKLRFAVRASA